jgi:hypothetical protein
MYNLSPIDQTTKQLARPYTLGYLHKLYRAWWGMTTWFVSVALFVCLVSGGGTADLLSALATLAPPPLRAYGWGGGGNRKMRAIKKNSIFRIKTKQRTMVRSRMRSREYVHIVYSNMYLRLIYIFRYLSITIFHLYGHVSIDSSVCCVNVILFLL